MKPISYVIDLGLDANLGMESGQTYPLQQGLVALIGGDGGSGHAEPQWFTRLRQLDTIAFRLWNITGEASGNLNIVSFSASFLSPIHTDLLSSPLGDDAPNPISFSEKIYPIKDFTQSRSYVFTDPHAGWLLGQDKAPVGESFKLVNKGRFLLQINVSVIVPPHGLKNYRLDPEMIVGPNELLTGPGGGMRKA